MNQSLISFLKKANKSVVFLVFTLVAESITAVVVSVMSIYFHGTVGYDYLITGAIAAFIATIGTSTVTFNLIKALQLSDEFAQAEFQRNNALEELYKTTQLNSILFEAVSDSLYSVYKTQDGDFIYNSANHSYLENLGISYEQLMGKNIREIIEEKELNFLIQQFETVIQQKNTIKFEKTISFTTTSKFCEITLNPFFEANGLCRQVIVSIHDISNYKMMELELQKRIEERTMELENAKNIAETANKAKSIFLSNMSHELRTPLNAILGFSYILHRQTEINPSHREKIRIIHKSGEHLLSIINDILEISKIEAGKITLNSVDFNLREMIADLTEMLQPLAHKKGLEFSIHLSEALPIWLHTDQAKLRQIIVNLVGNALKFTHTGSIVVQLSCASQDGRNILCGDVIDTGMGIAEENLTHILEPFVQSGQHEGTGLGLSITQELCKLMGGHLRVESRLHQGSKFSFAITFDQANIPCKLAEECDLHSLAPLTHAARHKILVVEDQLENRQYLGDLLAYFGFEYRVAENGQIGVEFAKQWRPDLILMDRRMPVMDGLAAVKSIRTDHSLNFIKIICVTAHAFLEEEDEMLNAGCDGFLAKPFNAKELLGLLKEQLPLELGA